MKYIADDYIPKGEIKGFPLEVVDKMLERQKEQDKDFNLEVFEKNSQSRRGFNWSIAVEGWDFWYNVIQDKDFNLFFKKYPKIENEFKKGDYVVLLHGSREENPWSSSIPINYVYRLREDYDMYNFLIEKDINGSLRNGWLLDERSSHRIEHINLKIRAATQDEIKEYKRLDKPFKITDMKKIIGYKAPADLFNGEIKKGELYTKGFGMWYISSKGVSTYSLPKEIVEGWEAVYEEVPKFRGQEVVKEDSYRTKVGCTAFQNKDLVNLIDVMTTVETFETIYIKGFGALKLNDLIELKEIINKL